MYADYLHGIKGMKEDLDLSKNTIANWSLLAEVPEKTIQRATRTSLTFRDVVRAVRLPKVRSL